MHERPPLWFEVFCFLCFPFLLSFVIYDAYTPYIALLVLLVCLLSVVSFVSACLDSCLGKVVTCLSSALNLSAISCILHGYLSGY